MSFSSYTCAARPEWIDYNGHMSEAYYVLVFGFATDTVLNALGLDEHYRKKTNCSLYTVEAHIRYLQEVSDGDSIEVRSNIVGAAEKKLHVIHEMHTDGVLVATEELLGLYVDQTIGRTLPLPVETYRTATTSTTQPPEWSGRKIHL